MMTLREICTQGLHMRSQSSNDAASRLTYGITVRGAVLGDTVPDAVQQLIK